MFAYITPAIDQVLFNKNYHYQLRGLIININMEALPSNIDLNRIISLTMCDMYCFPIIEQCIQLRSLKLIGETECITSMIKQISHTFLKLEQITIAISGIGSISKILTCFASSFSLRRLEICADHFVEDSNAFCSIMVPSKIEQFIVNSSSTIDWNQFSNILPRFNDIHLLNISLIDDHHISIPSFIFHNLRTLSLGLLEASFNWIVQLVATIPSLAKLKLNGLVREDGFIVNQRWTYLLQSMPNCIRIIVNVFLQQDTHSYFSENIKAALYGLDLNLTSSDDDTDCSLYHENINRWWYLRGIVIKQ
jgi:hypothetical protein